MRVTFFDKVKQFSPSGPPIGPKHSHSTSKSYQRKNLPPPTYPLSLGNHKNPICRPTCAKVLCKFPCFICFEQHVEKRWRVAADDCLTFIVQAGGVLTSEKCQMARVAFLSISWGPTGNTTEGSFCVEMIADGNFIIFLFFLFNFMADEAGPAAATAATVG